MIEPESKEKLAMSAQKKMWGTLATQLSHIVDEEAKSTMLVEELVAYQRVEAAKGYLPDEWWALVTRMTLGGEPQLPILTKLAVASSSEA